jgi:hypothetical protein
MPGNGELKVSRSPEQVRAEIERVREQIVSSATALREEVAMRTDWREWVRRRPGLVLAGAFALGFWIGSRD